MPLDRSLPTYISTGDSKAFLGKITRTRGPLSSEQKKVLKSGGVTLGKRMTKKELNRAVTILKENDQLKEGFKSKFGLMKGSRDFFSEGHGSVERPLSKSKLKGMSIGQLEDLEKEEKSIDRKNFIKAIRIEKEIDAAGRNINKLRKLKNKITSDDFKLIINKKIAQYTDENIAYMEERMEPGKKPLTSAEVLELIKRGVNPDDPEAVAEANINQPVSGLLDGQRVGKETGSESQGGVGKETVEGEKNKQPKNTPGLPTQVEDMGIDDTPDIPMAA